MSWEFFNAAGFLKTNSGRELVSSLPGSPVDGQEIFYQASGTMATDGIVWHLRYDASSASSYKWEFVGGGNLYDYYASSDAANLAAATWTTISATNDPAVTVPLAGEYFVNHSSMLALTAPAVGTIGIGLKLDTTSPSGLTTVATNGFMEQISTSAGSYHLMGQGLVTMAANKVIAQVYYKSTGGTTQMTRWLPAMTVVPIRVG